jgi:enterochelin esterase-like enzyme
MPRGELAVLRWNLQAGGAISCLRGLRYKEDDMAAPQPLPKVAAALLTVLGLVGGYLSFGFPSEVEMGASPTIEQLEKLIDEAKPVEVEALVSSLIEENRGDFPLIENSLVTFVYQGKVAVRANVPSDLNRWDTKAHQMNRLGATDLYYLTLQLPMDSRIDYKFYVDGLWMLDPLNSKTIRGGFGDNSEFSMPLYRPPAEIEYVDSVDHGTMDTHQFESRIMGNSQRIQVYLPYEYRPLRVREEALMEGGGSRVMRDEFAGTYPVVFVQDGGEYVSLASMVEVLDNTIYAGSIPPVVAVFIDPVDRNYEYWLNQDYEKMLVEEILPFIRDKYDISREAGQTGIMGASLGGAISMMMALDHPEIFGKCGSQSGAFEVDEGALLKRVKAEPTKPVDFYIDCGRYGDLLEENRTMRQALADKGYQIAYREFNEGHSWGNWRAHIDDMLVFFWGKGER